MSRLHAATLLGLLAFTTAGSAQTEPACDIIPSFRLLGSGIDDGLGPLVDVYAFQLTNLARSGTDITAIGLDLQASELGVSAFVVGGGGFYSLADLTIANDSLLDCRFPCIESFVVLPEGLGPLAVDPRFTAEEIVVNYTTAGGVLVAHGETTTVAHLSIPTGEVPSVPGGVGSLGMVVTSSNDVSFICPEPTAAVLLATAAISAQRLQRRVHVLDRFGVPSRLAV